MPPPADRTARLRWFAWLLPPLAPVLLLLPGLLGGQWLAARDTSSFVYALRRWFWRRLVEDGSVPLWNDGLFSGLEQVADPQLGLYAPLGWLYLLGDSYLVHELYLIALLALGGLGMAMWLRALTRDEPTAWLVGACYPLSGVVLSTVSGSPFLAGICLFPWALWASGRWQVRPSPARLAVLTVCLAWPVLEGDPFGVFWMSGILLLDALLGGLRGRRRVLLGLLLAGLLAVGVSAPAWLPAFDTLGESLRAEGVPYPEASWFSLAPGQLAQLVVPGLWGRAAEGTFWGQALTAPDLPYARRFWHDSLYLGLPLLLLAGLGAWRALRAPRNLGLLLAVLVFLGVALGDAFVLHPLLHAHAPVYAHLRFPAKFWSYANLFLFGLIGLGLAHLRARARAEDRPLRLGLGALVALCGLSAGLALGLSPGGGADGAAELLRQNALTAGGLGLAAALMLLLACLGPGSPLRRQRLLAGFMALALLDALLWAPTSWRAPSAALDQPSRAGGLLAGPGWTKLLRDGQLDRQPPGLDDRVGRASLRHNWGLLEGLRYTFGYAPTVPSRFMTLHGGEVFAGLPSWARALGVTHVLTTVRPAAPGLRALAEQGRLELVETLPEENVAVLAVHPAGAPHELFGGCALVSGPAEARAQIAGLGPERRVALLEPAELLFEGRRPGSAARAALPAERLPACGAVQPPPGEVRLEERSTSRRAWALALTGPGWLVVRDTFHPGWRARVDGREIPILRADYLGMAVRLGPDDGRLELSFEPAGPGRAARLSLLSLGLLTALLLLGLGLDLRRRRRLPAAAPPPTMAPP
ncbi:MAG TPA: hypothetical protein PK668_03695 [Myxococcota bacterium]|nr:hypothetical protein [Myxococcota bacterium]HRY91960.1 hypothetical protein [Myxococcota bacterium]HSA20669.1 hypothetical protein [Myxococcota bacterium]